MNDIYLSFEDLKNLFRRKRRKIFRFSLTAFVISLLYLLFTPITYEASATFQQAAPRDQGFDLRSFIRNFSGTAPESSTKSLMLSRTILGETAQQLGLQASLEENGFLSQKWDALIGHFAKSSKSRPCRFQNVVYQGKKPKRVSITFKTEELFEIADQGQIVTGLKGIPVLWDSVSLTLVDRSPSIRYGKPYTLIIHPKRSVIESIKSKLTIKPLREEKELLLIKFENGDPALAADLVNTLMEKYEEFLVSQNKTIVGAQLKYLDRRQQELSEKLDTDLSEHIVVMKKSLQEQGFMGVQQELESILEPLKTHKERLDEIEIELASFNNKASTVGNTQNSTKLMQTFHENLSTQIKETKAVIDALQEETPQRQYPTFAALVGDVNSAKELWESSKKEDDRRQYEEKKNQLLAHLHDFLHQLHSRQQTLNSSSEFVNHLESDFLGMTLENARQLFQQYCTQLDQLHSVLKQVIFFRDHLHEPHFELSSLTNVLDDGVTQQLVQGATQLENKLFDSDNYTAREQDRIKASLATQKRFLESHLNQVMDLGKIRIQLIQEKIAALKKTVHELLAKEKIVLLAKIDELKHSLHMIPDLWHMEKRLDFKAQLTKGMMEGLTQLTESKNLSRHLYQVESKPLDSAIEPLTPLSSHSLLKASGVGIGTGLLYYFFVLIHAFVKGLPLSLTTLRFLGASTCGSFTEQTDFDQLSENDLETLRSIVLFLLTGEKKGSVVALLGEQGAPYCFNLAQLLSLHEKKVAIIDCNLDRIVEPNEQRGLWHYLTTSITPINLYPVQSCDFLAAGGTTRHSVEWLASDRFKTLLEQCQQKYDFILLLRQAKLRSQDSLQMLSHAHQALICLSTESQNVIMPYLDWSRQKKSNGAIFAQYPLWIE
ncbi:MAG TPA: hypothetical protein PKW79_02530 [Rhabdochlamydiaceae bacterium]|nr:hypothetical protein [Rhabdochlamydiaceae bacterium]